MSIYTLFVFIYLYSRSICSSYLLRTFFFFKQKTAYEMRISDWSSDVCSSDLHANVRIAAGNILPAGFEIGRAIVDDDDVISVPGKSLGMQRRQAVVELPPLMQMGDDDRYPVRTAPWNAAFVSFALFLRIFRFCPAIDRKSTRLHSSQ